MNLESNVIQFNIKPVLKTLEKDLQHRIDRKTKPLGALGRLEGLALKIGLIQNSLTPQLNNPHIIVFAADHGIVKEGVSAYPQEVTYQMVMNFLSGGAAINVFCRQHKIAIKVVDAGVNFDFPDGLNLIDAKVAKGTKNFLKEPAMTAEECRQAVLQGAKFVQEIHADGCNVIGFGEMGIGNTSSASILASLLCGIPLAQCVGRGTGVDDEQLRRKVGILQQAVESRDADRTDPWDVLVNFGGFEIAMMCGALLKAAELKMIVLIDGFIATSAFLVAYRSSPEIMDYAIFTHQSHEQGHVKVLEHLDVEALVDLDMRLGEGTGVAVAYPVIQSAVRFLNEMASFDSAGVSDKDA